MVPRHALRASAPCGTNAAIRPVSMTVDVQELFRYGSLLVDSEQLYEATQVFSDLTKRLPDNADLWALIARIHLRRCDLNAHDEAIARAIQLTPERGMFHLRAALACPPLVRSTDEITQVRARTVERLSALEETPLIIEDIERDIPTFDWEESGQSASFSRKPPKHRRSPHVPSADVPSHRRDVEPSIALTKLF